MDINRINMSKRRIHISTPHVEGQKGIDLCPLCSRLGCRDWSGCNLGRSWTICIAILSQLQLAWHGPHTEINLQMVWIAEASSQSHKDRKAKMAYDPTHWRRDRIWYSCSKKGLKSTWLSKDMFSNFDSFQPWHVTTSWSLDSCTPVMLWRICPSADNLRQLKSPLPCTASLHRQLNHSQQFSTGVTDISQAKYGSEAKAAEVFDFALLASTWIGSSWFQDRNSDASQPKCMRTFHIPCVQRKTSGGLWNWEFRRFYVYKRDFDQDFSPSQIDRFVFWLGQWEIHGGLASPKQPILTGQTSSSWLSICRM